MNDFARSRQLRPRRRNLLFEVYVEGVGPTSHELWREIVGSITRLFGVMGLSSIDPRLIAYSRQRKRGIVKCSHLHVSNMVLALSMILEVSNQRVSLDVVKISGLQSRLRNQ